jgi:hypothetical protein
VVWVRNARQERLVDLRYGHATHDYTIREARAGEAGPVLERYVRVATKTVHRPAAPDLSSPEPHSALEDRPAAR